MSKVIVAKEPGTVDTIFTGLELEKALAGKNKILIKVNLRPAAVNNFLPWSITNLPFLKELTGRLAALGKSIIIAEGTSSKIITERAIENSGVKKLESPNVKVLNLNTAKTKRLFLPGTKLEYIDVYEPVLEADYVISLAVMKTHVMTKVTLSMKNMMGAVSELTLPRIHLKGLEQSILDLNYKIRPDLAIVDGSCSMEGFGPVRGSQVILNAVVAGFEPSAVDAVCCRIMGFGPGEVKHIGDSKEPEIIGEVPLRIFKRAERGALDFYYYSWFNWLMSKRIFHKIIYEYAYFIAKKLFSIVS